MKKKNIARDLEIRFRTKNGSEVITLASYSRILIANKPYILSVIRDITQRKQDEQKFRESQEHFATIFRQTPVMIAISTIKEGRYLDVNDAFVRILGYSRDQIIGHTVKELGLFVDYSERERMIEIFAAQGYVQDFEMTLATAHGERVYGIASLNEIHIDGEAYLLGTINNITQRKKAERELRDSEERFATFFRQTPVITSITDWDGRYVDVNDAYENMIGFSRAELIGCTVKEIGLFADYADRTRMMEQFEAQGYLRGFEVTLLTEKREPLYGLISLNEIHIDGGSYLLGTVNNITERKLAEEFLRQSEERYRTIGEAIPFGVWMTDPNGEVRYLSQSFLDLLGMTMDEVWERGWVHCLHPDEIEKNNTEWVKCIQKWNRI